MKIPFIISAFAAFLISTAATAQQLPTDGPEGVPVTEITFDESEYAFGLIEQGEKVRHIFRFTNTGSEPLILTSAKGSCGCTVPNWPKEPIKPGGTGAIVVEFNSRGKSGKQAKVVTVFANTSPAKSTLMIKGEVLRGENGDAAISKSEKTNSNKLHKSGKYQVTAYPNPATDILWLSIKEANIAPVSIEIFNGNGQLVRQKKVAAAGSDPISVDVNDFPAGTYWLSIRAGDAERISLPVVVN